jgi:hypothetical protein
MKREGGKGREREIEIVDFLIELPPAQYSITIID